MIIKPGGFNLLHWQNGYDWDLRRSVIRKAAPGIRVCSASNRKILGIITDTVSEGRRYEHNPDSSVIVKEVRVFWQTGPNRGKTMVKGVHDLVNYDAYKNHIFKELQELEDNEAKAAQTGL